MAQPIRTPNDLPYGERQQTDELQRSMPLPSQDAPAMGPGPGPAPAGGGGQGGIPPWLLEMESSRPGEPVTAGMDMGDGPGSQLLSTPPEPESDAEAVFDFLAREFGDDYAVAQLSEIRAERMARSLQPQMLPPQPPPLMDEEPLAEEPELGIAGEFALPADSPEAAVAPQEVDVEVDAVAEAPVV